MLTPAERNSLLLSLGFLILGAGIKGWKKWRVEIGPFHPADTAAATPHRETRAGDPLPAGWIGAAPAEPSRLAMHPEDSSRDLSASPAPPVSPAPSSFPTPSASPPESLRDRPRKSARPGKAGSSKPAAACPLDPNTASDADLARLPGVGPRTAAALIAHRKSQGPYRDIRELLEVKGIGEKKLALLAPCLIISGAGGNPPPAQAGLAAESGGEGEPASP